MPISIIEERFTFEINFYFNSISIIEWPKKRLETLSTDLMCLVVYYPLRFSVEKMAFEDFIGYNLEWFKN